MKRYLVMFAIVALVALPVIVGAEVNDELFQPKQRNADAQLIQITPEDQAQLTTHSVASPAVEKSEKSSDPTVEPDYRPNW